MCSYLGPLRAPPLVQHTASPTTHTTQTTAKLRLAAHNASPVPNSQLLAPRCGSRHRRLIATTQSQGMLPWPIQLDTHLLLTIVSVSVRSLVASPTRH